MKNDMETKEVQTQGKSTEQKDVQKESETYVFKTIDVQGGRKYVTVNERMKYFVNNPKYEGWWIDCTREDTPNQNAICYKACIYDKEGKLRATGTAEKGKMAFQVEKCETAAKGRALAWLGIGIDNSMSSWEEMKEVMNNSIKETKERMQLLVEMNKKLRESGFTKPNMTPEEKQTLLPTFNEIKDMALGDPHFQYNKASNSFVLLSDEDAYKNFKM